MTPENAGKWGSVQSSASSEASDWDTLDAIYDYAEQKGILFKQHAYSCGARSSRVATSTRGAGEDLDTDLLRALPEHAPDRRR